MIQLLTQRFGYQTHDLGADLDAPGLKRAIRRFARHPDRHPDDYVVVYLAGHGELVDLENNVREYRFLASDVEESDLVGTGVKLGEIGDWLLADTKIRRLLLILDTCFAGDAAIDVPRQSLDWRLGLERVAVGAGGALICSALPRQPAFPGQFTEAFVRATGSPAVAGHGQRSIGIDSIMKELHIDAADGQPQQVGYFPAFGSAHSLDFFPNPQADPTLIDHTLEEASYRTRRRLEHEERVDLHDQFHRRTTDFVGRRRALSDLARWLNDSADTRSRIVTGGPGSGKTSLLGVCASLASARLRGTVATAGFQSAVLPDVGVIDGVIYAGHRTTADVMARIAVSAGVDDVDDSPKALGVNRRRVLQVATRRSAAGEPPLTLLVDALDEADEPEELVNEVIRPLAEQARGRLRFLVGCRPKVPENALGPDWARQHARTFVHLDLDGGYADPESLKAVVERILREGRRPVPGAAPGGSVMAGLPVADLRSATDEIADVAGKSFYFATLIADTQAQLAATPDVRSPAWRKQLPRSTGDAMRADLERHFGDQVDRALERLRPLAYARGAGMPWEDVWPALVRALHPGTQCSTADLIELVENAGSYVIEGAPLEGRSTYRLFHQSLVEVLLDGRDPVTDEAAITRQLQELTSRLADRRINWRDGHPYTRTFLPAHAADAGQLGPLVRDPGFLLAAAPGPLMSAIDRLPSYPPRPLGDVASFLAVRVAADAYQRAVTSIRHEPPALSASALALAARCGPAYELADRIITDGLPTEWNPRWGHWREPDASRVIATASSSMNAVAVAELDGRPVVITGSDDRSVRAWDLATGAPAGQPFTGHTGPVLAVAVAELDGRPVVISGSYDNSVRVWDLATGTPLGQPFTGHTSGVNSVAVAELDGRPVVISGSSEDRSVRIWDLATGAPAGQPFTGHDGPVLALAVAELDGRPVVITGSADNSVRVWNLATGTPLGQPFTGHTDWVNAVAVAELDGRPVVISGSEDASVRVWDLATGVPAGQPFTGHGGRLYAVAVAELDGRPVIISGSNDNSVRVWDLATGAPAGQPFTGHDGRVYAVAVAELDGRPVVISGSDDASVRVWDLATGAPAGQPFTGHDGWVNAVAVAELDGRPVVISGSTDNSVRVWDLATGTPLGRPFTGHTGPVRAMAVSELDDRPVVVTGSLDDRSVRVWDVATGGPLGDPFIGHTSGVNAVAVAELDGRPVVVTGSSEERSVRVWDLATRTPLGGPVRPWDLAIRAPLGRPFTGHTSGVNAVTVAELDGQPVVITGSNDRSVRVWDLATGAPVGQPLTGHTSGVNAVTVAELDGQPVAITGSNDNTVRVWDLATGTPLSKPFTGHTDWVNAVAVAELDGRPVVISGSSDNSVRVWDLATRTALGKPINGHTDWVRAVAVAELDDRPVVISGSNDNSVRVWDLATGAPLGQPLTGPVRAVAVSELDGRPVVVSGSTDNLVRVWDLATGTPLGEPFTGHTDWVNAVAVAELDGRPVVISGSTDRSVRVWDLATGIPPGQPFNGHDSWVNAVAVAELDGRPVVISGSNDNSVWVWDLATGTPLGQPFNGHTSGVNALAVAELDGRPVVISGSDDATVRAWDLATGAPAGQPFTGHDGPVRAVAVAERNGRPVVITGSDDATVRAWDLATGAPAGQPFTGHDGPVRAVAVAERNGRPVVITAHDRLLVVAPLAGGDDASARVATIAIPSPLRGVCARGRSIVCAADQGIVLIEL